MDAHYLELNVQMAQAQYEMAEYKLMQTIYPRYASTYLTDMPGVWLALELAQDNLEEAKNLLSEGEFEEMQAVLEEVEISLHKAQEKSVARRWALPFSIKLVEMETDEARINLDLAKEELNKAIIIAPFDGVVTDIDMKTGERISAAAQVISVVDPTNIEMNGAIDEIDVSSVELGQEAIITLDALPGKDVKGKVTFMSRAGTVQFGVVSYKTIISMENPDEELRDGMSSTAEIIIERYDNVLLISNRAIRGTWDKPSVEVVVDGQVEQREISLGSSDGIKSEVLSGLEEGEIVVFPESQLPFRIFGG
jgi:RND family efflux transporter MFP subunit